MALTTLRTRDVNMRIKKDPDTGVWTVDLALRATGLGAHANGLDYDAVKAEAEAELERKAAAKRAELAAKLDGKKGAA